MIVPMAQFLASKPYHLQPGTVLRQFEVLGVIGQGGFALTYLGADTSLEREVVIKEYFPSALAHRDRDGQTVSPRLEAEYLQGLDVFFQETQALSQLQHPHIVDVLGVFQANDTAYMVMPYYAGEDLEAWLRAQAGPLRPHEAIALVRPLLEALEYVHGEGLIHRDVKPANILLAQRGSRRYLVLLDFGGARQFVADVTQTFDQILSPGYAPFEQYLRDGTQGPWTDVYACGALLYRMTVGERPPDAAERKSGHALDLSSLPPPFAAVLDKALAEAPDERYQDIGELERALEPLAGVTTPAAGGGVAPGPAVPAGAAVDGAPAVPGSVQAPDAGARRGAPWPLLLVLALAAVAGVVWWQFFRPPVHAVATVADLERLVRSARAGSVIEIAGEHVLSATLTIDRPLTLRGVGAGPPLLRITGGRPLLRFTGDGTLQLEGLRLAYEAIGGANGVEVERGALIMTSTTLTSVMPDLAPESGEGGHGVRLHPPVASARLVDVRLLDHLGAGLTASGSTALEVERSVLAGNLYGMYLSGAVQATFVANQFVENVRHGLELRDDASVELEGDRVVANGAFALFARGRSTVRASELLVEGNHEGMVAEDQANLSLSDSTLRRNTVTGAHYRGSATGIVSGNVFDANVVGLVAQEEASPVVTGNHFSHNQRFAVRRNCAAVIENNTYEANGVDVSGC